jgi:shikimate dehydrogenase
MRCAVLGSPIAHSLSPVLHRAAYRELGLDWTYDAVDLSEDGLAAFLAALTPDWRGLSLTMPLKRRIVGLCDQVDDVAAMLESANTVVLDGSGGRWGYNTDVGGFVAAFAEFGVTELASVCVVGAGATAASALAAVAMMGCRQVTVLARSVPRAAVVTRLAPLLKLDIRVLDLSEPVDSTAFDAVVSTIPAAGQAAVADRIASIAPVVFDVVYDPRSSPLTQRAQSEHATVIDGFWLLLHQAAKQVELMTGVAKAPIEQMRAAGLEGLGNR